MPLIHSSSKPAFKTNVRTLMGEVGKSPHVKSPEQALAIAYAEKRRHKAAGGGFGAPPWYVRNEARGMTGPLHSVVPGRTDHIPLNVPAGAYVLPADHVSHMGQGNSQAGLSILSHMFSSGPYGSSLPSMGHGKSKFAKGGNVGSNVPIMAAGGEFVIPPEAVTQIGGGDIDHGHKILDHWVKETRKKHVKTLSKLPGPSR